MHRPLACCLAAASLTLAATCPAQALEVHQHHQRTIWKGDDLPIDTIRWTQVVNVAPADSDQDGVQNSKDPCPSTPGSEGGCPPPTPSASLSGSQGLSAAATPTYSGTAPPASIAACESGGSPTAVSSDGTYRGKWQFDYGTWASVGGSGDPAAASESEQDYRAGLLYARSGSSPWPVCGG